MNNSELVKVREILKDNYDVVYNKINISNVNICIVYINTICDTKIIGNQIIRPLLCAKLSLKVDLLYQLKYEVLQVPEIDFIKQDEAVNRLLLGDALLFFDNDDRILGCQVRKDSHRSIDTTQTEAVVKGPREGFVESLNVNMSLIRKRFRNPNLKLEKLTIGGESKTDVVLIYVEGTSPKDVVKYIREKLSKINQNNILQINQIQELLETKQTTFDTVGFTEKPDVLISKISEGAVAILVEGDPFAIYAPYFFIEHFHSPNDYEINQIGANYLRLIRIISFGVSLLLPALYVALMTHHFGLIPRVLAFRLAIARSGVPYPLFLEVFLLMFFFQVLREAGVRLPQPMGQTISIVGGLILGDVAVQSGLASTASILVVSLSSIAIYTVPNLAISVAIWNNFMILCSAALGLPGFYIGFGVICAHIAGLESCGYPYTFPLATKGAFKNKDHFIRGRLREISKDVLKEKGISNEN